MNMKKILSVVLAGAMVIGMNSFAMAASSITSTLDPNTVSTETEGADVSISLDLDTTNLSEEDKKVVEGLISAIKGTPLAEAFEEAGLDLKSILIQSNEDGEEINTENLKVLSSLVDLVISGVTPTKEEPVVVTFTVNNKTENVKVYALHLCEEHGWELLETTDKEGSDNQVEAEFHSASPVILVYTEEAADAADEKSPATK